MPANVAGQNLPRTGKAARQSFVKYKAELSPEWRPYAEAYWRHKRREAVTEPDHLKYGIPTRHAVSIEKAIDYLIQTKSQIT